MSICAENWIGALEAYLGHYQTSLMAFFAKIANG